MKIIKTTPSSPLKSLAEDFAKQESILREGGGAVGKERQSR